MPRILVFSGSTRTGSYNALLAARAADELRKAGGEATLSSLSDYPLPIYDGDLEKNSGQPADAVALKRLFCAHHGVFIASPEYNASVTPLLKNALDWVSRVREGGEPALPAYKNRAFAIAGASPGPSAAIRSLLALRQILAVGCGALVIPEQVTIRDAANVFGEDGEIKDERTVGFLRAQCQRLVVIARFFEQGGGA